MVAPAAVCAALLCLYAVTAGDYPHCDDSAELMTAGIRLGIAHPTGYPLLLLLGKAASLLPVGTPAYRLNLLVALFGALTCGALCYLMCRAFRSIGAAVIGSVALGVTPVLWRNSTSFEVYPLNALFIVLALLLAGQIWAFPGHGGRHRVRKFYLLALVIGLGISHHLTFVTALPAVLWIVWRGRKGWHPGRAEIGRGLLFVLLGLTPWLYLPIRGQLAYDPYTCWVPLKTLRAVFDHMTARQYGANLFAYSLRGVPLLAERAGDAIWRQFGALLAFVPFGLVQLRREARVLIEAALLLLGINLALFLGYTPYDYAVFFLPTYVALAVLIGAGLGLLDHLLAPSWSQAWRGLAAACAVVLLVALVAGRYAVLDSPSTSFTEAYVNKLASSIPENAVIMFGGQFASPDRLCFPLLYAKRVEGRIPDLVLVTGARNGLGVAYNAPGDTNRATMLGSLIEETGASPALKRRIAQAVPERQFATFLREYDGPRPIFTDAPDFLEKAGVGGAYSGYLWRVRATAGYTVEADPKQFLDWAFDHAASPTADETVHDNLSVPFLNYMRYLLETDQFQQAAGIAEVAAQVCHKSSSAQFYAIRDTTYAGDNARAWRMIARLRPEHPYRETTYRAEAALLAMEGRYREALACIQISAGVGAARHKPVAFLQALCYLGTGDAQRAKQVAGPELWPPVQEAFASMQADIHQGER